MRMHNSNTLLREISSQNNNGVRLFEGELFLEAIDYFQLCLDQISEYEIDQQFRSLTNANDGAGDIADDATRCEVYCKGDHVKTRIHQPRHVAVTDGWSSPKPFNGWSKSARLPSMEEGSPFLFARAIRLREHQEEESPHSYDCDHHHLLHAYKAALHYNLALTYQHCLLSRRRQSSSPSSEGEEPPHQVSMISSVALVFRHYEASYQEWKAATTTTDDSLFKKEEDDDQHDMILLGLALFNNMGVVFCSELAKFREAFECFKAACGVMSRLDDTCLKWEEIHELSMNALLVPTQACPAA